MHQKDQHFRFLYFALPSLLGLFCFLIPVNYRGVTKVPIAHLAMALHKYGTAWWPAIIVAMLIIAALLSCWATISKPSWTKAYPWLGSISVVSPSWLMVRIAGALLAIIAFYGIGEGTLPVHLYDKENGVLFSILPVLLVNLLFGLLLVPLLMQFGLLELIGTLTNGIMRPLFQLPGRASIDCMASWVGDATIGTIMSIREYEKGGYTVKEASVVITCFSAVSITFCVFLLDELDLQSYFGAFYLTTILSSLVAAVIIPRLPPLSCKPNFYIEEKKDCVPPHKGGMLSQAFSAALEKAAQNMSLTLYMKRVGMSWVELILGTLPSVMTIATLGFLAAQSSYMQPILHFLGKPFVPLLTWAGIPEAVRVSETLLVGFVDMLIPTTMIRDLTGEVHAITRFIVAAVSVTQVIYLSELGPILLSSKLKFSLKELWVIFLQRTLITLPIILACAKFFFR